MDFEFKRKREREIYEREKGKERYPREVVDAFFDVMTSILAAHDIRDLYAQKSLRFEKLKGPRKHQRSMRLNEQYRLIVTIEENRQGQYLLVHGIEDYHS